MKKIGNGRTAEVFLTNEGYALKLFYEGYPESAVEYEVQNALWVQEAGLPVPQCFGRCDADGRYGILYECVTGESLLQYLMRTGDAEGTIRIMVSLHRQMLQKTIPQAMDIRQWLSREMGGEDFSSMPGGDTLLHGDFHPDNIQIDGSKVWVLDWMNLCRGDRLYDIARTFCLIADAPLPPGLDENTAQELKMMRTKLAQGYLAGMDVQWEEIERWAGIIHRQIGA